MAYIGDIRLGDTFDTKFCTVTTTGAPTTLAGSPVISAYPGNSTTQLTAGITLSVDFDTVTGLHNVRVVATSGNGYATATDYQLVITTGTVGGTSVVGYVVAEFSIEKRSAVMPTTAARTLDVTATGEAGIDWANVGAPTTALDLSGTTIKTTQKVDVETIKTQAVTLAGGVTFPAATLASTTNITAGTVTTATNVTTVNGLAANVITAASINADAITAAKIADGAIDAATFAAGAINAAAIAADAITDAKVAADVTIASVTGAVGSVTAGVSVANGGIASTSFAAGAIDAAAIAADAIGASEIAADAIGSSELAATAANEIADALLARNIAGGSSAGRIVTDALRRLRNRVAISAGTATVYAEDDTASAWTAAVTTAAGNPIVETDPA